MKKQPRYYQQEAYDAIIRAIGEGERPYVSMSTGSGKALVCAMLAEKALKQGVRALILVPTSELVSQNYKEHYDYTDTKHALGICSAKLQKAQVNKQIVYATYTSFLRRRATSGKFNVLIIDEAHYVNPGDDTSYQKIIRSLLRLNPDMKIVGLTATPYRADQGMLHEDSVKGKAIFTGCAYETNIPRLIEEGYLSHVESISGDVEIDLDGVKMKGADYDASQVGVKFDAIVGDAIKDMRLKFEAYNINTALIYTSTLDNARRVLDEWGDSSMRLAWGDMSQHDRKELVRWIREGEGKRYVVNVGLFVTGFDHRQLECVVMAMATKSLVKYVQIAGRVIRAHDDKEKGYVLDYGSNIERHGPIDATIPPRNKKKKGDAPKKLCLVDGCGFPNLLSAKYCKECGAMFISDESKEGLYSMRTKAEILAAKQTETYDIDSVEYEIAHSKKSGLQMIKQLFYDEDFTLVHTNYLCLDHPGFAGEQSRRVLMSMFVDSKDFFLLGKQHINVNNVYTLLTKHDKFFKKIKAITLKKTEGNYKELKSFSF